MKSVPAGAASVMLLLPAAIRVIAPVLAFVLITLPFKLMLPLPAAVDIKLRVVAAEIAPLVFMSPPDELMNKVLPAEEAPRLSAAKGAFKLLMFTEPAAPLVLAERLLVSTEIAVLPPMAPVPLLRLIVPAVSKLVAGDMDIAPEPPAVRVMELVLALPKA